MVLQLLACLRPTGTTGTEMGVATDHHIFQMEMGEGKRKSRQIAHHAANPGLAIDFYQGNVTALDSLTPEVTNGPIHHSMWHCLTFGGGFKEFLSFFFFLLAWEASYLHGRVLISSKMSLRNKAGQVCQGSRSHEVSHIVLKGSTFFLHIS